MGIGEDEEFEHVAETAWTVGQLRAALEGVADETELIAWVCATSREFGANTATLLALSGHTSVASLAKYGASRDTAQTCLVMV